MEKLPELGSAVATVKDFIDFLPVLTKVLQDSRILVVLDNLESALTDGNVWIDADWSRIIEALTTHTGLSRFILTSRQAPPNLSSDVATLRVTALSLDEATLLASELGNLARLFDSDWEVVVRALQLTQGHPKLIELADAAAAGGIDALSEHLARAETAWAAYGTDLRRFVQTGTSIAADEEYWKILTDWASSSISQLGAAASTLAHLLGAVEDGDRELILIADVWPLIWSRVRGGGDTPDFISAFQELEVASLVDSVDADPGTQRIRMHPVIVASLPGAVMDSMRPVVDDVMARLFYSLFRGNLGRLSHDQIDHCGLMLAAGRGSLPTSMKEHKPLISRRSQCSPRGSLRATSPRYRAHLTS